MRFVCKLATLSVRSVQLGLVCWWRWFSATLVFLFNSTSGRVVCSATARVCRTQIICGLEIALAINTKSTQLIYYMHKCRV